MSTAVCTPRASFCNPGAASLGLRTRRQSAAQAAARFPELNPHPTVIDDADSVSADAGSASADDGNVSDLKQQKKGVRISAGTQRGLARLSNAAP